MFKKILLVLFIGLWHFNCAALVLTAETDRPSAMVGENFVLTIKADEKIDQMPDLQPLEKDFRIFSRSVSQQNYIINGVSRAETQWQIGLRALRVGKLEIPAIRVGKQTTSPFRIDVIKGAPAGKQKNKENTYQKYQISSEIFDMQPQYYVQQPVKYNVVITDSGSLQGGEPVFDQQNSGDWIIRSLGNPDVDVKTIDGKYVRTIKFKYVLFAQKSGELNIPAVTFNGVSLGDNSPSDINIFSQDMFNLSMNLPSIFNFETPVALEVPAKPITILPVPENYSGRWWLPAENVTLKAEFTENKPSFKVGEAFGREIVLTALGMTENQLPQMSFNNIKGVKQYPEKSFGETKLENNQIKAVQKTKIVYVPERSGQIVLPEISVDWYNVNTKKIEKAVLPAQTIEVAGNREETKDMTDKLMQTSVPENTSPKHIKQPSYITGVYLFPAAAFLSGAFLSYLLFRCRLNRLKPQCEMRQYPDYLIKKAYQNDFRAMRDGLISWATGFYPDKKITNLKDVADAVENKILAEQIEIILEKLYNPKDNSQWNPKLFADKFQEIIKARRKTGKNKQLLPPLYE